LTHTTAGQSSKYKNETKIKIRSWVLYWAKL
jgi:hypothetical protein